jgi:hypothetical protein
VRLKLIACKVLCPEICALIARSPHPVDVEFFSKGLPTGLQEFVDGVDPGRYDAILLACALCADGADGLVSRSTPIVIPRPRQRNSGVSTRSTGWIEQPACTLEQLTGRHGEDRGRRLFEEFQGYRRTHRQLTYIRTVRGPEGEEILPLFERLLRGDWDERDFLVVPPGWRVKACSHASVFDKEPAR